MNNAWRHNMRLELWRIQWRPVLFLVHINRVKTAILFYFLIIILWSQAQTNVEFCMKWSLLITKFFLKDSEFSLKLVALSPCHASSCHAGHGRRLVWFCVFDLLLPATPLSLLDILLLSLLLLLVVPLPAALLPGLLHGLKLAWHIPLVFVQLWHVASGHWLSGSEEFLWLNSERDDKIKLFAAAGAHGFCEGQYSYGWESQKSTKTYLFT